MDNWRILHYALRGAVQRRDTVKSLRNMVARGELEEKTCPASDMTAVLDDIAEIKRLIREDEKERYGFAISDEKHFRMMYEC